MVFLLLSKSLSAQETYERGISSVYDKAVIVTDSVKINFPISSADIDWAFDGNIEALRHLSEYFAPDADSLYVLREVRVVGGASPDGSYAYNRQLSQRRAEALFDYCRTHINSFSSLKTEYTFIGRDWAGLLAFVEKDPAVPFQRRSISILKSILNSGDNDATHVAKLRSFGNGIPYRFMLERYFQQLRSARLYLTFEKVHKVDFAQEVNENVEPAVSAPVQIERNPVVTTAKPDRTPFSMAFKTNLLYDAALIPNVGVDIYLGHRWSLGAEWMYSWWNTDKRDWYWRIYGGDIALRKWFGKKSKEKPLQGHYIGVYGQMFTYDFEVGSRGYLGDKWSWSAGVEYGYSLPVARRINIEFGLGIGYVGGEYMEYLPMDTHYVWQTTKQRNYIGPTKLEIGLVWIIGRGNYNADKGRRGGGR